MIRFTFLVAIGISIANSSALASIQQSSTGLVAPENLITFDEIVFPNGTTITDEYSGLGVEFVPNLFFTPQNGVFPGVTGNNVGNFFPVTNPFSIEFTFSEPVFEAAFGFATNPATTTVTTMLGGVVQDTLTASTTFDDANTAFFTITGSVFDEIEIFVSSDLALVDNIQFSSVSSSGAIPEPTMFIVWAGLACCGTLATKRRR